MKTQPIVDGDGKVIGKYFPEFTPLQAQTYDVENDLADLQKQLRTIDLLVSTLKKAISTEQPSLSGNEGWELIRESNSVNFLVGRIKRYYLQHPTIAPDEHLESAFEERYENQQFANDEE
jgi:hypothetical protein